jgi:hypothetical protein
MQKVTVEVMEDTDPIFLPPHYLYASGSEWGSMDPKRVHELTLFHTKPKYLQALKIYCSQY